MKRVRILFMTAVIVLAICAELCGQSIYDTYSGFTVPTTAVLPAAEIHPSLFFAAADVPALKTRAGATAYASIWSRITSNISKFEAKTVSSSDENDRPKIAKYCAFAWLVNSDATAKQKAIDALMTAYDYYGADSINFDKPYDEIYRGTWIQNYCEAYDWMRAQLTAQQDSSIRAKLTNEARILRQYMTSYAPRPHNHRSKPAYGLATAALTFSSDPRAADWLTFALQMLNTVTKYQFSSDGIYREGAHYYLYSLVNEIPFLWHYKNVSSVDLFPYYKASFEWPVLIRDQRGWLPNNEDGNLKPAPTHMVAKAYQTTPTRLHSTEPLAKILQWNWATTKFFTVDYTGATNDVCWDIDEFLTYDASIPSVAPDVDPTLRLATGQVVFRNGWANADTTMRYLLYLAAAAADNHDHPDELSYIVNARNTCLAVDGGYGQDAWNHNTWYLAPISHNLVTAVDSSPSDFAVNQTPPDRHFLVSRSFDFSEKEAKTSAKNGRIRRGIAFIDNDYWIVYDVPTSTDASTVYKLMVHARGALARTGTQATWSVAADNDYGAAARLHSYFQTTGVPTFSNKNGYTCLFKDSVTQQYVEVQQTKDSVAFLHLLSTSAPGASSPSITNFSTGTLAGFEVQKGSAIFDAFMVQVRPLLFSTGFCSTDAQFAWVRRSGSVLNQFAVNEATLFRWNEADFFSSSAPLTLAADLDNDTLETFTIDSTTQPTSVSLAISNVVGCQFNKQTISFSPSGNGGITLTIPTAGTLTVKRSASNSVNNAGRNIPGRFILEPNYPNPFNPSTTMRFFLPASGPVTLRVLNILGRVVRVIAHGQYPAGLSVSSWDGLDEKGMQAASGVYFFEIQSGTTALRTKGLLVR
jgi:Heparinase II/III-like protein/FlgD Ig-like domain